MRKGYICLLAVAMVIASIMIAGCTTSNQANQASSSETSNATTTAAAKTTNSSVATASPTVTPSPSTSPTATPSTSGKIATSIKFTSNPSVRKGQSLGINVISSVSGLRICAPGLVTATIGTVTSGGSDCYNTAYLDTSSLNPGTYDVTLKFVGDGTNQPSQSATKITITA